MQAFLCLALSCAGFGAIALSMRRHHQDVFGRPPAHVRKLLLAAAGWMLLGAAIWPAIDDQGISVGLVFWFGIVTAAALIVAMSLTYGPGAMHDLSCRLRRAANSHPNNSTHETKRRAAVGIAALSPEKRN